MALFGSTSPSYLIMASLDLCNACLAQEFSTDLAKCVDDLDRLRRTLTNNGWQVEQTDPLRVTINAPEGDSGINLAEKLRAHGVVAEYADPEFLVFMATPSNTQGDFDRIARVLGVNTAPAAVRDPLPVAIGEQAVSIRKALFSPHETIPATEGLGRICASPTVSCPPAIPIAVSGEVIGQEAMALFEHYGVETLDVLL